MIQAINYPDNKDWFDTGGGIDWIDCYKKEVSITNHEDVIPVGIDTTITPIPMGDGRYIDLNNDPDLDFIDEELELNNPNKKPKDIDYN